METVNFDIDKIVAYLKTHSLKMEDYWNAQEKIKIERLSDLIESDDFLKLEKVENRFAQEILLKETFVKYLNKYKVGSLKKYNKLSLWIIQDWGGIYSSNDKSTLEKVKKFLKKNNLYSFDRIASTSKVASFQNPKEQIIYDSRVAYSLNWILFKTKASDKFFPIPEGRNARMIAFDLGTLIRLSNINEYRTGEAIKDIDQKFYIDKRQSYKLLNELIGKISLKLWKGHKEEEIRTENLYYTEMLLFAMADREIYDDIVKSVSLKIQNA
jgi:hypothetical protein